MTSLTKILHGIPTSVPCHLLTLDFLCSYFSTLVSNTNFVEKFFVYSFIIFIEHFVSGAIGVQGTVLY